jgi:hypothetical protein
MHEKQNEFESDKGYCGRHVEYSKILLEGGADYSLLGHMGDGQWMSGFQDIIGSCSMVIIHILIRRS